MQQHFNDFHRVFLDLFYLLPYGVDLFLSLILTLFDSSAAHLHRFPFCVEVQELTYVFALFDKCWWVLQKRREWLDKLLELTIVSYLLDLQCFWPFDHTADGQIHICLYDLHPSPELFNKFLLFVHLIWLVRWLVRFLREVKYAIFEGFERNEFGGVILMEFHAALDTCQFKAVYTKPIDAYVGIFEEFLWNPLYFLVSLTNFKFLHRRTKLYLLLPFHL